MSQDLTSFQKDLVTPGAGTDSELYRAISPLIDLDRLPQPKTKFDQERLEKLKNDLRQGTLGLEYLTGLKNNKVETFFDTHPVQATASNVLGNAGRAGLGIAGGGTLINALRQWKNLSRTENAYDARRKDPIQEAGNKLYGVTSEGKPKPIDDDVLRVFGSGVPQNDPDLAVTADGKAKRLRTKEVQNLDDLGRRMDALDSVSGSQAKGPRDSFRAQFERAKKIKDPTKRLLAIKMLMENSRSSKAYNALKGYADLHTDLQRMRDSGKPLKGGFGSSIGDKIFASDKVDNILSKLPTGVQSAIKSIIPHSSQGFEDLARKRILMKYPNNVSEQMLQKIVDDVYGTNLPGATIQTVKGKSQVVKVPHTNTDKVFNRAVFGPTGALKSSIPAAARMVGGPALIGAGVAGAGLGLNELLKLIQSKVYGTDKIKEWKRNALKAKGEFEEAARIK